MNFKDTAFKSKKTFNVNGKIIDFYKPKIMGILNITPDSFYAGSRYQTEESIKRQAGKMIDEGADILDAGGYSTRPGADDVPVEEELNRLIPAIKSLKKNFPGIVLSADTFRSKVAIEAINEGADIINDISGGNLDEDMFDTIARYRSGYVLMHSKGNPKTMQSLTQYENLECEIIDQLQYKKYQLIEKGVKDIFIDPGIGFAKSIDQNFRLLRNLHYFQILQDPLLIGISRKSMIWKYLKKYPDEALNGTTILNIAGLINKASIIRVHDVKEAFEAIKLFEKTFLN